ncbi:hypothetical protein HMPREF0063_10402 [Aeromicrobium marinum DSM 15272]|uniref:Tat pathway signal sequence domain protein n=2 Tax=Aeromicrobium marinum TaxID=219314 RepID=E2S8P5_9ACTN|nr:hypothetical protein HMPREF0063_10402 [Aeromicrobium marinum DSM 15272]
MVVGLLVVLLSPAGTAAAAETDDPSLSVTITALTPAALVVGEPVTLSGSVTNDNDFTWSNLQAYLVIPRSPFTTRAQITQAIAGGRSYTGERVVALESIDDLGDLSPGASRSFSVTVPWEELEVTGAEGVYPVGIQLLGTRPNGERSNVAVARATTFVPLVADTRPVVPAGVLWPFVMPIARGETGRWVDPDTLVDAVAPGGRLRNLVDLVASTPVASGTVLIDPALLDGLADLAENRGVAEADRLSDLETTQVRAFLTDLTSVGRRGSTWIAGYGLPDQLALSRQPGIGSQLQAAVTTATESATQAAGIPGRRATWIAAAGLDEDTLVKVRRSGDQPVVVASSELADWDRRDGSVVSYPTDAGPVPLLVTDDLAEGVPGSESVVTVRQRLLAEAALASFQQAIDPDSRADAVTVVPPTWDPGPDWQSAGFAAAWTSPWVAQVTLDDLLLRDVEAYTGRLADRDSAPLPRRVLTAAAELQAAGASLEAVTVEGGRSGAVARLVAGIVGLRWRDDVDAAVAIARSERNLVAEQLAAITIEGPPSFLLSGTVGQIPLTISNDTTRTIRVGVRIGSSNPDLTVPDVEPVDIAAGARTTIDVTVDVGDRSTSTLSARLVSDEGAPIGEAAEFNVRSSNVGTVLWVAMAAAGLLVLVALLRRFRHGRRLPSATEEPAA